MGHTVSHPAVKSLQRSDYEALKKILDDPSFDINGVYRYIDLNFNNPIAREDRLIDFAYHNKIPTSFKIIDLLYSRGAKHRMNIFFYFLKGETGRWNDNLNKEIKNPQCFLRYIYSDENDVDNKMDFAIIQRLKLVYCFQKKNMNLCLLPPVFLYQNGNWWFL